MIQQKEIGKNVQNEKTEQTPKAPFGVWVPEGVQRRSMWSYTHFGSITEIRVSHYSSFTKLKTTFQF